MQLKAPTIDRLIEHIKVNTQVDGTLKDKVNSIFKAMCAIAVQGDDEYRKIWLVADRGTLDDFGRYKDFKEEDIVNSKKGFRDLWRYEYPHEKKWYSVTVTQYQNVRYLYINSKLVFSTEAEKNLPSSDDRAKTKLLNWIGSQVTKIIKEIKRDVRGYNARIEKELSYTKRLGKILRSDYWDIFPEEKDTIKKSLKPIDIKILHTIVELSEGEHPSAFIKSMTAGDFFRYCEIGYNSNKYFKKAGKNLTPKEKYASMADGRDCGLKTIKQNSVRAFSEWHSKESRCGGHPWEICRGGNSTHISLYVQRVQGGWQLQLAGMSPARVIETVRMAVALCKNDVPFQLQNAREILNLVTGKDYIGIVPEHITPRYCHGLFPDDEELHDFMNLDESKKGAIVRKAIWFPETEVNLQKNH